MEAAKQYQMEKRSSAKSSAKSASIKSTAAAG